MKVIIATPRSGSTFYSRYLWLKNPNYICVDEYFQPYFYSSEKNEFDTTTERLNNLKDNYIIKILAGKEIDFRVWNMLHDKKIPVIILKRKNIRRQLLSFGLSCLNDIWVKFETESHGIFKKNIPNNTIQYKAGEYKKWWFDSMIFKYNQLSYLTNFLTVSNILYYEDIITLTYPTNEFTKKNIPIRQNNLSDDDMLNFFTNKDDLLKWINTYEEEITYGSNRHRN